MGILVVVVDHLVVVVDNLVVVVGNLVVVVDTLAAADTLAVVVVDNLVVAVVVEDTLAVADISGHATESFGFAKCQNQMFQQKSAFRPRP